MLLFIAQQHDNLFGGGIITGRNLKVLKKVFGANNIIEHKLPAKTTGGLRTLKSFLLGYLLELSPEHEIEIINTLISNPEIKYIFLDSSLLGRLALKIKKRIPNIHIIVFFHNVEFLFFKDFLKTTKRYLHSIGLLAVYKNERNAVQYADNIITLNQRDSNMLIKQYNKPANLIWPISIEDTFDIRRVESSNLKEPVSLLFVGSRFYPNEQGMLWFIKEVIPHLKNAHLKIVGKGFEALRDQWKSEKVEVVGTCNDIAAYYYNADIVVAPIFTGSGMKTKTAEALMYGKTIIASTEAMEGYDIDKNLVGGEFNTATEYINYINDFPFSNKMKFNENSRIYFSKFYSPSASVQLVSSFFEKITTG